MTTWPHRCMHDHVHGHVHGRMAWLLGSITALWPCGTDSETLPCTCVSHQVVVLCTRMLRNWLRNPIMLASECVQYVFMSVFVGELKLGDTDYW